MRGRPSANARIQLYACVVPSGEYQWKLLSGCEIVFTGVGKCWPLFKNQCTFDTFCSCDLDLDPMTFIQELNPYCLEIHRMCKYELPTSTLDGL